MNVFRMTLATCMRSADWHKAQAFLVNKMCVQAQDSHQRSVEMPGATAGIVQPNRSPS